ncbi:MAG: hypothetical protein WBH38_08190 [Defluviitoga tunisiensis]
MENKYSIKSFYIPKEYQEIFQKLDDYCKYNSISKSYVICEAVKEYLEREKRKKVKRG